MGNQVGDGINNLLESFLTQCLTQIQDPDWSGLPGYIEVQTHRVMQRIGRVLATAGLDFGDVVRVSLYMTNLGDFELMNAVYRTYFSDPKLPARTCVGVANLLDKQVIEIDCVARLR
jgi:2-iminobutanoate/2-iminopropanoate deaminase